MQEAGKAAGENKLTDEELEQVAGGMVISSTAVPKAQVIKAHS